MAIRVCPLCQAEFLEYKTVCTHCNVTLLNPDDDIDPRSLEEDDQVVYDLSAWPLDAQAEAAQVLAESGIPHAWLGAEVIVPIVHEQAADRLLEQVEEAHGLDEAGTAEIAGTNGETAPDSETEYDLSAWTGARRIELVEHLVELNVAHRWEAALLVVPTSREDTVDDVLDEMEGWGSSADATVDDARKMDPAEALSALFLAGERLRKGKVDVETYGGLLASLEVSALARPPYGLEPAVWVRALELGEDLADAVADDTDDIESVADELYRLLRPLV